MGDERRVVQKIEKTIAEWRLPSEWLHSTKLRKKPDAQSRTWEFVTLWSKPTAEIPIPEDVVSVFFSVDSMFEKNGVVHEYTVTEQDCFYRVEGDTMVHRAGELPRLSVKWLNHVVQGKQKAKE